ncbi:M23 family metallopeptidase [Candidatus Peregrinibacteria bacterium]|nr:M23 family metallopeptidase [Candidatus Peregrinibacteria bacterium]
MFRKLLLVVIMLMAACESENKIPQDGSDAISTEAVYGILNASLTGNSFKIPVPQGNNWEITESWAEHCKKCNAKGYDKVSDGFFGDFCQLSHATNNPKGYGCKDYCKYGWDFNLSGNSDLGKSVLASGDGTVLQLMIGKNQFGGYKGGGWGNTVLINHGNNICSRYAHLKDDSIAVAEGQDVCQGLKIGEVGGTPSVGTHLHFQFEDCETHLPIAMGFTDGNGVPECVMGDDLYTNGVYTALKLTNTEKSFCSEADLDPYKPVLDCKMQCPLNLGCANKGAMPFPDLAGVENSTSWAVNYLWHECAVDGKNGGNFSGYVALTRAEALKIALTVFGLTKGCEGTSEPFGDVNPTDWFYPYVVCGVKYGIISTNYNGFNPNEAVYFSEAAKIAVEAAVKAGKREIQTGTYANFPKLKINDWSYKYMQTLAFYNGMDADLTQKDPYDYVQRGEYARMVAALSPCYCSVNKCEGGCDCNKATYICGGMTVSKSNGGGKGQYAGGSGGGASDAGSFSASSGGEAADAGSSEVDTNTNGGCTWPGTCKEIGCECGKCPSLNPNCGVLNCGACDNGKLCSIGGKCQKPKDLSSYYCESDCKDRDCGPDKCGGYCGICPKKSFCNNTTGKCISCTSKCTNKECGFDGCDGSCGTCSSDKFCDSYYKCQPLCTPSCSGKECGSNGCGGSCGECPSGKTCNNGKCVQGCVQSEYCAANGYECGSWLGKPGGSCQGSTLNCGFCSTGNACQSGKCVPQPQVNSCDPTKGYTIHFNADFGKWESITSPSQQYYVGNFTGVMALHYNCSELPAMLLISQTTSNGSIWLQDNTLPSFAVWWPWPSGKSIPFPAPSFLPDVVINGFPIKVGDSILIRLPYN